MEMINVQSFWRSQAFQILRICTVDPDIDKNNYAKCHQLHPTLYHFLSKRFCCTKGRSRFEISVKRLNRQVQPANFER